MSALKQVFSCFDGQGREGLFQGGIHLPIAGWLPWGTMQSPGIISPSPTQAIGRGAFYLNYWHLHLGCRHLLLSVTTKLHHPWWLSLGVFLCQQQSLDMATLQAWSSRELNSGSQLQNLTLTDCYSITIDAIQKSRVTALVIFHVY